MDWIADKIEKINIDDLQPYKNNARTHSESQIVQIAKSIREFGFTTPVLVDGDNNLIAGHGRIEAARKVEMKKVPAIRVGHLSDRQKQALILADNKIASNAGWDLELLGQELSELAEMEMDLSLTGFDEQELDGLLKSDESILPENFGGPSKLNGAGESEKENINVMDGNIADDEIPEIDKDVKSKTGDIWELGNHRLMCGDSTIKNHLLKLLDGYVVDWVFSDPPYGIDIVKGSKVGGGGTTKFKGKVGGGKIVESTEYKKIRGDGDTNTARKFYNLCKELKFDNYVLWGGNYYSDFLPTSPCWLVWDKQNTGNFADVELAWCSEDRAAKLYEWLWNGMSRKGDRKTELKSRIHPTQKPVGLFIDIFKDFKFDSCLDGFGGSGTTLIACEKMDRKCFMMEDDPYYCEAIIKRWEEFTGLKSNKVN